MIFYENTIYALLAGYFFASLLFERGDTITMSLGLAGVTALLLLTHYNEYLKRNRI